MTRIKFRRQDRYLIGRARQSDILAVARPWR
jgi:hypothetical protein